MSDFLSPAINDVLKGDDMDDKLRELFFKAAGGISDMGNEEIAEAKRIFLDTIEKAKPEKKAYSTELRNSIHQMADEAYVNGWNENDGQFESNLKKEIGK